MQQTATRNTRDDYSDVVSSLEQLRRCRSEDRRCELRAAVIERCLPLAEHIARRFRGRGLPEEDLCQVACVGLVNAVDRFDLDRGTDFVSYAVPTMMGEVRRCFRDTGWALRVPRRVKELQQQIAPAAGRLAQQLGRAATAKEIALELGADPADVAEGLLADAAYRTDSTDAAAGKQDTRLLVEKLGGWDRELEKVDYYESIRPVVEELPDRERRILGLRFFGCMTQAEIAQQVGVSQMHVSRLLSHSLTRIRTALEASA